MNELVLDRLQHLMNIREDVENLGQSLPWNPAADWLDQGTHLLLLLDVPGVDADSLSLSESGDTVTVSGERKPDSISSGGGNTQGGSGRNPSWLSRERPQGSFSRTLTFPEDVLPQTGEASLSAGILSVRFEKKHPTIDVSSQQAE